MCHAIHPLCTNCETFNYECTYNDPTKKRGPPKGKLVPMMTGYIEAIEARLHRMEGLLGGLVKDKDPRAEIVRAELDAMAREAEMTGLKLRRSKAYEEINHAMAASASSSSASSSSKAAVVTSGSTSSSPSSRIAPQSHQQQQQSPNHNRPVLSSNNSQSGHPSTLHLGSGYRPNHSTTMLPDTSASSQGVTPRSQLPLQPSPISPASRGHQHHPYEHSRQAQQTSSSAPAPSYQRDSKMRKDHLGYSTTQSSQAHPRPQHASQQFTSAYGHTGYTNSSQHSNAVDHRSIHHRPGANSGQSLQSHQSHHQAQSLRDRDHHRTNSNHSSASSNGFGTNSYPSHAGNGNGSGSSHGLDRHRLVTHRPSLAAHQLSNPLTGYMPIPDDSNKEETLIMPSIDRAKYFIRDEYDNSQLATVQALLLMAVQQMGFCESQRAWLYVGMAIRMAQDLGINKESSAQEQTRNRLQCELRKRTWWSIYVVERLVCAGLGRPLTITQKDCATGYPLCEDDDRELLPGRNLAVRSTLISNFVHLITLSKIQGNIMEYIKAKFNPPSTVNTGDPPFGQEQDREYRTDTTAMMFATLDRSLSEWRQNLPDALQSATAQSPHFGLFLHLTYNTLIIMLHRPEFGSSLTSASLCNQAADSITDITEILMDAKALTSTFISCLYAIFSAGIVHFMNVPSVKKPSGPGTPSPREHSSSHTASAKTNLKRCIDALKFLASHWVSAARRAKVLEDLLDLKHVSLKDLEVDTFQTSPVGPSWALETSRYKEALIAPRAGQDKLRQQCRSKAMAIHSLLANDEDFKEMQKRRGHDAFEHNGVDHDMESAGEDGELSNPTTSEPHDDFNESVGRSTQANSDHASSPTVNRPPIGLGVHSPHSPITPSSPSIVVSDSHKSRTPEGTDPMASLALAKTDGSINTAASSENTLARIKDESGSPHSGFVHHDSGLLTPMTMTTLVQGGTSPRLSPSTSSKGVSSISAPSPSASKQGAMLDPFSMPSSISFPDRSNDRPPSNSDVSSGSAGSNGAQFTTVWTTDSVTNRTTARSAASSPMILSSGSKGEREEDKYSNGKWTAASTPSVGSMALQSTAWSDANVTKPDHEESDLVWNDMPPTLGLDEWTAYIGAMMMRWLYASGQSSPRSTSSL
ncbi:hypothetical protein BGZ70_008980 [Mortierella alpina]|uniref:Xylanolytic transcriptional activator regulatory domain-containing protein n=1 Tax=Mortierella alpina TaxID=64518 RepID=A0A9P6J2P8_MORAP|nr:hypothetical protein BGZ70_008980 [Mortierella alpina]